MLGITRVGFEWALASVDGTDVRCALCTRSGYTPSAQPTDEAVCLFLVQKDEVRGPHDETKNRDPHEHHDPSMKQEPEKKRQGARTTPKQAERD